MKAIVRVDKNWGIGKDGQLLTYLPDDMKFFRSMTKDKIVVMGRKTLDSFPDGKPLKNRINLVLTSNLAYERDGLVRCSTINEVLEVLKAYDTDAVYIIGGQSVYEQFLPYCDTVYVTRMAEGYCSDTYFVNLDQLENWSMTDAGEEKVFENQHYTFQTYKNSNPVQ